MQDNLIECNAYTAAAEYMRASAAQPAACTALLLAADAWLSATEAVSAGWSWGVGGGGGPYSSGRSVSLSAKDNVQVKL